MRRTMKLTRYQPTMLKTLPPTHQPVEDEIPPAKEPGRDGFRHSGIIESIAHQAVHNPAIPRDGCEDCLVGAKREAPFVANASKREVPEEFGSLVTMDRVHIWAKPTSKVGRAWASADASIP